VSLIGRPEGDPKPKAEGTPASPAAAADRTARRGGAAPARVASLGSSQGGLRQYNERVVLHAVRLAGALPAAEIARATQLTAQTVSMITKRLLDDGLLLKGAPRRGKVGQPSVPLSLNPEGAYAIGIKVGRRSLDVLLVDFTGRARERHSLAYRHPDPATLLPEIGRRLKDLKRALPAAERERVLGVGIAAPLSLGGWRELLGFPPALAERWQATDLRAEVQRLTPLPVTLLKDTAAACVAELVAGHGRRHPSFLYVFVDTFVGGGLVLDSHLRGGASGNAGAIGSLPLAVAADAHGAPPAQLLAAASLLALEQRYAAAGLDDTAAADARAFEPPWRRHTEAWLEGAAAALAMAVNTASAMLDLETIVIDGSTSRELLAALLRHVEAALPRYSWQGVARAQLVAGTIGSDARAIGGALLPLHAAFSPDRELFLKAAVAG
jgi:predicted NBD/HSP70 family sugar kinase